MVENLTLPWGLDSFFSSSGSSWQNLVPLSP